MIIFPTFKNPWFKFVSKFHNIHRKRGMNWFSRNTGHFPGGGITRGNIDRPARRQDQCGNCRVQQFVPANCSVSRQSLQKVSRYSDVHALISRIGLNRIYLTSNDNSSYIKVPLYYVGLRDEDPKCFPWIWIRFSWKTNRTLLWIWPWSEMKKNIFIYWVGSHKIQFYKP